LGKQGVGHGCVAVVCHLGLTLVVNWVSVC
jgi:hypothetical protein